MDPRLWALLNTAAGEVFLRRIWLDCAANVLVLECNLTANGHQNSFRLRFTDCRDLHWQANMPDTSGGDLPALGLFLGQARHHRAAVIYTGGTEMSVLYGQLELER
ncbi:MAG: hypothetical protein ACOYL5_07585 [Phototrophicaceae bacterium]|jgi:hypothetical protein